MSLDVVPDANDTLRALDADGAVVDESLVPDLSDEAFLNIYRRMTLARRFDRRVVTLNRQGRVGSFPPHYGQEAAQVASASALDDDDWVVPSYRDHGALISRGIDPAQLLRYYMGHPAGNGMPEDEHVFSINGSVGSQSLHAMGLAWGSKLQDAGEAVVCYFGDGATSQGDVHEALNFAGVFDTPNVFFCQNNGWAISLPRERQTASETIAQKAVAYGFEGVRVDGTDPLAVYSVTRAAVEKAKNPDDEPRPTFIEAVLYRLGAHSTADDPSKYRDGEEAEEWEELDAFPRYRTFLRETGRLDDELDQAIADEVEERVDRAVEDAESADPGDAEDVFLSSYANQPPRVREQYEEFRALREQYGEDAFHRDE